MAIEIRELVIKATVENLLPDVPAQQGSRIKAENVNINQLISEVIKKLNDKNER